MTHIIVFDGHTFLYELLPLQTTALYIMFWKVLNACFLNAKRNLLLLNIYLKLVRTPLQVFLRHDRAFKILGSKYY